MIRTRAWSAKQSRKKLKILNIDEFLDFGRQQYLWPDRCLEPARHSVLKILQESDDHLTFGEAAATITQEMNDYKTGFQASVPKTRGSKRLRQEYYDSKTQEEYDAELAAAISESLLHQSVATEASNPTHRESSDYVRSPIPSRRETLLPHATQSMIDFSAASAPFVETVSPAIATPKKTVVKPSSSSIKNEEVKPSDRETRAKMMAEKFDLLFKKKSVSK